MLETVGLFLAAESADCESTFLKSSGMRFRVGVSKCFNLPPQRSGVSVSARTL